MCEPDSPSERIARPSMKLRLKVSMIIMPVSVSMRALSMAYRRARDRYSLDCKAFAALLPTPAHSLVAEIRIS